MNEFIEDEARFEDFVRYYLSTRPIARQLDPAFVREICAETWENRKQRGASLPGRPSVPDVFRRTFKEDGAP